MESRPQNTELGFSELFSIHLNSIDHLNLTMFIFCKQDLIF